MEANQERKEMREESSVKKKKKRKRGQYRKDGITLEERNERRE